MMIGDDDVDPRVRERADRLMRTGAAIARDHERRTRLLRGLDAGGPEIVAIREPVGHERNDARCAQPAQYPRDERRGAHAIDVVVAVYENRLAGPDRISDAGHGPRQIVHGLRR